MTRPLTATWFRDGPLIVSLSSQAHVSAMSAAKTTFLIPAVILLLIEVR
jgi:hypothetical protein